MRGLIGIALLLAAAPVLAELNPGEDGWQSWRIEKHADTGRMCCYSHGHKSDCSLDGRPGDYRVDAASPAGQRFARVYARMKNGVIRDVHTLSDSCPVSTATPINDLGLVANADSVAWLNAGLDRHNADEVLLSISVHAGDEALSSLEASAQRDRGTKEREQAIFWLAQHRGAESRAMIADFAKTDRSGDIREHSVFALSQLPSGDNVDALESILADRSFPMDSRKQALFWLAQTDSDDAFAVIDSLLDPK